MPGVDVTINDEPQWNTTEYTVEEDATPLDPTSSSGGSPTFSFGTNLFQGDKRLIGRNVSFSDGSRGRVNGKITGLGSQNNSTLLISGETSLSLLNVIVDAAPFSGTLAGAFGYYLGLVGLTSSDYQVDTSIATRPVTFPGWSGNLQDQMKALCAGQQIEMSYVDSQLILRAVRQNVAQVYRDSSFDWTLSMDQQAQQVTSFYYQGIPKSSTLAYPLTQPDEGADIQQVDDNQQVVVNINLTPSSDDGTGVGASLSSIDALVAVDSVIENIYGFTGTSSYSIIDSNNKPFLAATWVNLGGSINAELATDGNSITLTIIGPDGNLGPYRIASTSDGGQTFYGTIRITGTGTFYNKQLWTVPTGLTNRDTSTITNATIDNFAINTIGDANSAVLSALRDAQGPSQQITVKTKSINTVGDSEEYTLITFAQWDAIWGGGTFAAWDASWAGHTFDDYDEYLFSLVRGKFANQAFGNVGGARVWNDDSFYRITTASISEGDVSYTAVVDNTFQDWDNVWGGKTFAAWDAIWGGLRFLDYTPTLLSPGSGMLVDKYMDPSSMQDLSNLTGLGYEHFPNLQQWHRAAISPMTGGYGVGGYGNNPYGL